MKTTEQAVIASALLVGWAVFTLAVAGVALVLTVAGWRPSPPALVSLPMADLEAPKNAVALGHPKVSELRQLARKAGHKALARSGRKAELLSVLTA